MAEHPNAAMMRRALEAIRTGDTGPAKAMWADDIEWHAIGLEEPIRTKDEMFAFLMRDSPVESDFEVHDVVANEEHIVALMANRLSYRGQSLEFRNVIVYHVREGKVTARWPHTEDNGRVAEFFAQAESDARVRGRDK